MDDKKFKTPEWLLPKPALIKLLVTATTADGKTTQEEVILRKNRLHKTALPGGKVNELKRTGRTTITDWTGTRFDYELKSVDFSQATTVDAPTPVAVSDTPVSTLDIEDLQSSTEEA